MHPSFCLWIFTEKDGVRSHDISDNDFWGVGAEWFSCCLLFLFRCCLIFLMMSMKIIKPLFQKISKTNKFKKSKQNSTAVHLALRAAASLSKGLFLPLPHLYWSWPCGDWQVSPTHHLTGYGRLVTSKLSNWLEWWLPGPARPRGCLRTRLPQHVFVVKTQLGMVPASFTVGPLDVWGYVWAHISLYFFQFGGKNEYLCYVFIV